MEGIERRVAIFVLGWKCFNVARRKGKAGEEQEFKVGEASAKLAADAGERTGDRSR